MVRCAPIGASAMKMKKIFVLLVSLSLLGCSRGPQWSESTTVVHAAEMSTWTKTEIPLTVHHDELPGDGSAFAQGFWQSTSSETDKQLVFPIAVRISCDREEKVCREADASVQLGILQPELIEYDISSWTRAGIVADDTDDCNRHSLAIDFKTNSVTVTDYPIRKVDINSVCKPLHDAHSYRLHGGQIQLYPPAPWDPLEKREGTK